MSAIKFILIACGFLVLNACAVRYKGQPEHKHYGTIHNEEALPYLFIHDLELTNGFEFKLSTSGWRGAFFRTFDQLESSNTIPIETSEGQMSISYKVLDQTKDGCIDCEISWKHYKYGEGSTILPYRGQEIYAIKKPDFSVSLRPRAKEQNDL